MTTIAFIGLGIMGSPMAGHLVKAGHRRRRLQPQPGQGRAAGRRPAAAAPTSIAEAVQDADVVAMMVPDSPDVEEVARRRGRRLRERASPGTLIIDFSSIRPDVTAALAAAGAERGLPAARRPGLRRRGRRDRARRCRSWSAATRRGLRRRPSRSSTRSARPSCTSGPAGSGQTVKAANQLIVAGNIQLLAEALVFLEAYGVDTEAALEVLGGGLAGSQGAGPEGRRTCSTATSSPGFRIDLHHKDMGIVTAAAREAGVVHPARRARRPADGLAPRASGDGGLDHSALLRGVERLSGRPRRDPPTS